MANEIDPPAQIAYTVYQVRDGYVNKQGCASMWNVFWGLLIVSIGLVSGDSVFYGDFSPLTVLFDVLGTFFIGKGLWTMHKRKSATQGTGAKD